MLGPIVIPLPLALVLAAVMFAVGLFAYSWLERNPPLIYPELPGRHRAPQVSRQHWADEVADLAPASRRIDSGGFGTLVIPGEIVEPARSARAFDPLDPRTPLAEVERWSALAQALGGDTRELVFA